MIILHEGSADVRLSSLQSLENHLTLKSWLESWAMSIPPSAYHAIPTTTLFQLMHIVVALAKWAQSTNSPNATHGQPTSISSCHTIRRLYEFTEDAGLTGVQLLQQLSAAAKTLGETTGLLPASIPNDIINGQNINVIPSSPVPSHANAFLYPQQTPELAFAYSYHSPHHSPPQQQHSPQYFTPSITPVGTTPEMQALQIHQPSLGSSLVLPPASHTGNWVGPAHDWSAAPSCETVWSTAAEPTPTQKSFDGVDPQLWYGHPQALGGGMDDTQQAWQRQQGNAMEGDFANGGYGFNVLRR